MLIIFSITLVLSAFLLFWIELLFAKQVLPILGGVPAVWNGCMVFFQVMLLLGYLWAYFLKKTSTVYLQQILSVVLLLLCGLFLPMQLRIYPSLIPGEHPIPWLFLTALSSVGIPFFLLASLTPTLQSWLAQSRKEINPYILYMVSNAGSIMALIAFPTIFETLFTIKQQISLWQSLFILNLILVLCGILYAHLKNQAKETSEQLTSLNTVEIKDLGDEDKPKLKIILRWILLSFLPSSLLLGTTTFITTELSPIPLFWAVPLMVYLLTFILVFAPKAIIWNELQSSLHLVLWLSLVAFCLNLLKPTNQILPIIIGCNLLLLFFICWLLHGKLAQEKPPAKYLTSFYLTIAFGGMLGGIFNSILAPLIFKDLYEYPLIIFISILVLNGNSLEIFRVNLPKNFSLTALINASKILVLAGFLGIGCVYSSFVLYKQKNDSIKILGGFRSFFGIYKVVEVHSKTSNIVLRVMKHGSTNHGMQYFTNAKSQQEPTAYYSLKEPIAEVWKLIPKVKNVAVIGLGTGGLSAYAHKEQTWDFYEVDSSVKEMAKNYFTFLKHNPATVNIIIGDGRLELAKSKKHYDILVIDAFNSDSIPTHLLTKEAFDIYKGHLNNNGLIAFHVSNRYLALAPVIKGLTDYDDAFTAYTKRGPMSQYVLVGKKNNPAMLNLANNGWQKIIQSRLWTDDFSNVFLSFKVFNH